MTKDEVREFIRECVEKAIVIFDTEPDMCKRINGYARCIAVAVDSISTPEAVRALLPPDHVLVHVPPGWGWRGVASRGAIELCDDTGATRGELVKDEPDD